MALLFVVLGAPNARAVTITDGTINFVLTGCYPGYCGQPGAATGSFIYDNTTNMFTSFSVAWDSLSFNLVPTANAFADAFASGCASLLTGDAFIEDLVCSHTPPTRICNEGLCSWQGYSNVDGVDSFSFIFNTGAGPYAENLSGAVNDEIDEGTYTVTQVVTSTPEPPSLLLLGAGLAGLFTLATRRKRHELRVLKYRRRLN